MQTLRSSLMHPIHLCVKDIDNIVHIVIIYVMTYGYFCNEFIIVIVVVVAAAAAVAITNAKDFCLCVCVL